MIEVGDVIDGGRERAGGKPRRQGHRVRRWHHPYPLPLLPARSRGDDRFWPRAVDRTLCPHPDGWALDPETARVLGLSDRASYGDDPEARAQHFDHAAHPVARRTGADIGWLHHRGLRTSRDG